MCRLCNRFEETINNITYGCPIVAKREYKVKGQYSWDIYPPQIRRCQYYNIHLPEKYYDYEHHTMPVSEK